MFRIDDPTAAASLPTPGAAGTPGYWTEGNPATSTPATNVRADFLNMVQEELISLLTAAGASPSKTTYNQVLNAIKTLNQQNAGRSAVDTGVANAAVLTFSPAITALTDGMVLWFKAAASNTGATTLNVNGLGASPVLGGAHSALQGGEIVANGKCQVVWSATLSSWVLIECTGAAVQVGAATKTGQALSLGQFPSSFASAGYVKIPTPNGTLIVQWGSGTTNGSGGVTVTLPIAFTSAVYQVAVGGQFTAASGSALGWQASSLSTIVVWNSTAAALNFSFIAIGV